MAREILITIIFGFMLTSCANINLRDPNENNINLQNTNSKFSIKSVNFKNSDYEPGNCQLFFTLKVPKNYRFDSYIKEMLNQKLMASNIYDPSSDNEVLIVMNELDFNPNIFMGKWIMNSSIQVRGKHITISTRRDFSTNFDGAIACNQVAEQFPYFLNQYLEEIISNKEFQEALDKEKK